MTFPMTADNDHEILATIDYETGELSVYENHKSQNGTPSSVYHGHASLDRLGKVVTSQMFEQLQEETIEVRERIKSGYKSEWSGQNHVGVLDDDAIEAIEQYGMILDSFKSEHGEATVWPVEDWLSPVTLRMKNGFEIDAGPKPIRVYKSAGHRQLARVAKKLEVVLERDRENADDGTFITGSALDYIEQLQRRA